LDAQTGAELWRFAGDDRVYSSPAIANSVVYVGSGDFNLYALDAVSGTELWRFYTGDTVYSSPAVVDGVVYVGSRDSNVYAIGAPNSAEPPAPMNTDLETGGMAQVTANTVMRGAPTSTAVERAELAENTIVTITGESETVGDTVWWPVTVDETGDQGWVDEAALEPTGNAPD